jgi:hypothetical protein
MFREGIYTHIASIPYGNSYPGHFRNQLLYEFISHAQLHHGAKQGSVVVDRGDSAAVAVFWFQSGPDMRRVEDSL